MFVYSPEAILLIELFLSNVNHTGSLFVKKMEIDSRGVVKIVISLKKGGRGRLILEVLFH